MKPMRAPLLQLLPGLCLCACLSWPLPTFSDGALSHFELRDGSVITGELLGLDAGGYRVRSPSLGVVTINESEVQVMRRGDHNPAAPDLAAGATADGNTQLQAMQQRLASDPKILEMIMQLQNDPALMQLLADPALLRAIGTGDIDALRGDPRLDALMQHPGIREIIERVGVR